MRQITHLVIHHSASPLSTTFYDILGWHTDPNKVGGPFDDIGYHGVILSSGQWLPGPPFDVGGAPTATR